MLTYYMGWYPIDIDHETSTANIDIHITPGFELTGSGIISRKADSWHMGLPKCSPSRQTPFRLY